MEVEEEWEGEVLSEDESEDETNPEVEEGKEEEEEEDEEVEEEDEEEEKEEKEKEAKAKQFLERSKLPPRRIGKGNRWEAYNDGLLNDQRRIMRKTEGLLERYWDGFKRRLWDDKDDFDLVRIEEEKKKPNPNFRFMHGRKPKHYKGESSEDRRYNRHKTKRNRDPKKRKASRKWDKAKKQCPFCSKTISNKEYPLHKKRLHQPCVELLTPMSQTDIEKYEKESRGEYNAKLRRFRITGTRAYKVVSNKFASLDKLAQKWLLNGYYTYKSPAMKRGNQVEHMACSLYAEIMGRNDVDTNIGFFTHPNYAYLGATPDAKVGADGFLEVKSPIASISEIVKRKSSFLTKSPPGSRKKDIRVGDPRIHLKRSHPYFIQVCMELMCTQTQWIDFMVYYLDDYSFDTDILIERIHRKEAEAVWEKRIFPKLKNFYESKMGPPSLKVGKTLKASKPSSSSSF